MKVSDNLIANILKKMGVNPNETPHWKIHIHKVIDQSTRDVIDRIKDGYLCSYCGRHSYYQAEKCDGCGSIMQKVSDD